MAFLRASSQDLTCHEQMSAIIGLKWHQRVVSAQIHTKSFDNVDFLYTAVTAVADIKRFERKMCDGFLPQRLRMSDCLNTFWNLV